jgi:tRNA-binding protein
MAGEIHEVNHSLSWADFERVDMRVGTIIAAKPFEKAKKPAYQLQIDFGPLGVRHSSAQITTLYTIESLIGKQVIAVINFPPKQIANFFSECLVLGMHNPNGVVLLTPDSMVANGSKIA